LFTKSDWPLPMKDKELNELGQMLSQKRIAGNPPTYPVFIGRLNKNQIGHEHASDREYLDRLNAHFGFRQIGNLWQKTDVSQAQMLLSHVLQYSLPYRHRVLPEKPVKKFIRTLFGQFTDQAIYYTNTIPVDLDQQKLLQGEWNFEYLDDNVFSVCVGVIDINQVVNIVRFDND
jgi:hypothetical protein